MGTPVYIEHSARAVDAGKKFEHVMAIALDPRTRYLEGALRCIKSRKGDVTKAGYVDRSVLHKVKGTDGEHFSIGKEVAFKDEKEIVRQLGGDTSDFIGLEDPDIWIDEKTNMMHLYFTMPFLNNTKGHTLIHLGHAVGKDLDSLRMTMPVLFDEGGTVTKELSIAPMNKQGFRYNLVESAARGEDFVYSTVRVAHAGDMGGSWGLGKTIFNPEMHKISWIGGHASPGPLLPKDFIDVGEGKLLGIMNGRESNTKIGHETHYGIFSAGLFIYDYENGKIDWVSPEPFIRDSEATTITFASQFVPQGKGHGILYAHVDDSFVRAYTLSAEGIKPVLES